jgi:hypothetical protein
MAPHLRSIRFSVWIILVCAAVRGSEEGFSQLEQR